MKLQHQELLSHNSLNRYHKFFYLSYLDIIDFYNYEFSFMLEQNDYLTNE